MRMLAKVTIPVEAGNRAVKDGSVGKVIQGFAAAVKPEALYFTVLEGRRCMIAVFDLPSPADVPVLFEPMFLGLDAQVEVAPALNGDDLQKGLSGL